MSALLHLLLAFMPLAADPPVKFTFTAERADDGAVLVHAHAVLADGWYIYATELPRDDGPLPTEFRLKPSQAYTVLDGISEPAPGEGYDPNFAMVLRYHQKEATFTRRIKPMMDGPITVVGEMEYMCCTDKTCLPPLVMPFSITVPAP